MHLIVVIEYERLTIMLGAVLCVLCSKHICILYMFAASCHISVKSKAGQRLYGTNNLEWSLQEKAWWYKPWQPANMAQYI